MKKTFIALSLPIILTWSGVGMGQTCYTVEGEVKTVNISETLQQGIIDLVLLDANDAEAFRETGELLGEITGATVDTILLSHHATFDNANDFHSNDDQAYITGVRKWAEDGTPCSYFVSEKITNIAQGGGFFANVNEVYVEAIGYISACVADGENENEFELTGTLCVD